MTGLSAAPDTLAVVRYNRDAIDEVIRCVRDGICCALMGPRLSGKTELLRFVAQTLTESLGWTCIYIDLYSMRASTLQAFFADLIRHTARGIHEMTGRALPMSEPNVASSAVFRGFLAEAVNQLGRDLILIIEHLEALPNDLVQALLTSLRAAFMDQQTQEHRVMVVVSGALSLATLTVGESSPFRGIARRVFVGDLSKSQSEALIAEYLASEGVAVSKRAQRWLLRSTSGDPYLIRTLCQRCAQVARVTPPERLRARDVKLIVRRFLRDQVYGYAPLQEAVRLIEEDPDLLRCILLLLSHGTVPKAELPLPLSPDLDPLYLTGVVEQIDGHSYRVQNEVYSRFLGQHFHPGRAGHLLAMAGRWDSAIDYLEAGIRDGNEQSRSDLLPATINSMYASEYVGQAAHFLTRGLSAAFGVVEARVWYALPHENRLRQVGFLGPSADGAVWSHPEMPILADRLEARAYRQARTLRGQEGERHVWRVIPLLSPGRKPVGVVTICDDLLDGRFIDPRERDLQLAGYLNQAARAIQAVSTRRRELALAGRMQASLLPGTPPQVVGWQFAATLRPARETSGDFYDFIALPGGRLGIVIADVADKGMGAALYMALSRTLIRTYAVDYPDRPDLALRAVNERILADTQAELFVTVFYGILDPSTSSLTYCNAGHLPPYLLSADAGGEIQALPGRGMALGIIEATSWGHTTIEVTAGSLVLFYTDGVMDAMNPQKERFGSERMLEIIRTSQVRSAQGIQDALLSRLQQFIGDEPQFDDITMIAASRHA
jgi:serine phosphatase RsbU (regulator of sigma subunit)